MRGGEERRFYDRQCFPNDELRPTGRLQLKTGSYLETFVLCWLGMSYAKHFWWIIVKKCWTHCSTSQTVYTDNILITHRKTKGHGRPAWPTAKAKNTHSPEWGNHKPKSCRHTALYTWIHRWLPHETYISYVYARLQFSDSVSTLWVIKWGFGVRTLGTLAVWLFDADTGPFEEGCRVLINNGLTADSARGPVWVCVMQREWGDQLE
jgi:hypothetical protein